MHTALATACRTCPVLGWSQPCSTVTNRASAHTALMLGWYVAGSIVSLPARSIPGYPDGDPGIAPTSAEPPRPLVIHARCPEHGGSRHRRGRSTGASADRFNA